MVTSNISVQRGDVVADRRCVDSQVLYHICFVIVGGERSSSGQQGGCLVNFTHPGVMAQRGRDWFGIIERQAIHRGIFTSVRDLMIKIR